MSELSFLRANQIDEGALKISVVGGRDSMPIDDAKIMLSYTGDPDSNIEEIRTDNSGMSEEIILNAPPLEYSMEPGEEQPFSQYTLQITAPGYRPVTISGVQIFSGELALQNVRMSEEESSQNPVDRIVIPVNTLFGDFPPKIPEADSGVCNRA